MPKTRSTLVMDEDLWKRFRMIAILNDMEVSELVEQALREKLERMKQLEQYDAYKEVGSLRVSKETPQPQQQQLKGDKTLKEFANTVVEAYRDNRSISNKGRPRTETETEQQQQSQTNQIKDRVGGTIGFILSEGKHPNMADKQWQQLQKKCSTLEKIILEISRNSKVSEIEATKQFKDQNDLIKKAADDIGTTNQDILNILTKQIDYLEKSQRKLPTKTITR